MVCIIHQFHKGSDVVAITLLILLVLFAFLNFYYSIQILRRISNSEVNVSFFEIRWQVHKHMGKYKQLCRSEDGHLGVAWYGYWCSLFLMFVSLVLIFTML